MRLIRTSDARCDVSLFDFALTYSEELFNSNKWKSIVRGVILFYVFKITDAIDCAIHLNQLIMA